jgi:protocadherin Fat 1/2/3
MTTGLCSRSMKKCVAVIDRNIKFQTESGQLQAIDFDRDDMVTGRIVGGNEDGCFGLDGNTGKLRVMCDLREVRLGKRLLNVTATDGEYYSEFMMDGER